MKELKAYFSFDGNSSRSEYWAVNLICYAGFIAAAFLAVLIVMSGILGAISGVLIMLGAAVSVTWLVFAVSARRCRDIGISPWFTLALLIPYIAIVPFIVFGCLKGKDTHDHSHH